MGKGEGGVYVAGMGAWWGRWGWGKRENQPYRGQGTKIKSGKLCHAKGEEGQGRRKQGRAWGGGGGYNHHHRLSVPMHAMQTPNPVQLARYGGIQG